MEQKSLWLPFFCISSPPGAGADVGHKFLQQKSPLQQSPAGTRTQNQNVKQGSPSGACCAPTAASLYPMLSKAILLHDSPAPTKTGFYRG